MATKQLGVAPSNTLDTATKGYVDTAAAARLLIANNLSDLLSAATARTNLGITVSNYASMMKFGVD